MLIVDKPEKIPPNDVTIPGRLRHMDEQRVLDMMESLTRMGQMTPIQLRIIGDGDDVILVAGRHRLEAARRLEWPYINMNFVHGTEDEFRLWEIAENLHRSELTVLERSQHIAEWIRLTEKEEAAAEAEKVGQLASLSEAVEKPAQLAQVSKGGRGKHSGISAASQKIGVKRRDVQRAVKIDAISPAAQQAAREAGLDKNQSALLKVASAPVEEQVAKVDAIKAERSRPHAAEGRSEKPLSDRRQRHKILDAEVAEVIAALEDALGSRFEEIALLLCNVDLHRLHEKLVERLPD